MKVATSPLFFNEFVLFPDLTYPANPDECCAANCIIAEQIVIGLDITGPVCA